MSQNKNHNFDLERRTTEFAKRVVRLCKALPRNPINDRFIGQVAGSSGSMGANYREANDALGQKDFLHRMRIARKETKETLHWLELIEEANPEFSPRMKELKKECDELRNIFSAIIKNTEEKNKQDAIIKKQ